jgi:predicted AlkP superfamily pyrophosphatase or phosphodiesterase
MNKTLKECDDYVGQLLQIIDNDEYLKRNLNVIITSDHGMKEVQKNHTIKLEDYIDSSLFSVYGSRAFVNIFVHSGDFILNAQFLKLRFFYFRKKY